VSWPSDLPGLLVGCLLCAVGACALALAMRGISLLIYRKWFRQGIVWDAAFHLAAIRTLKRKRGFYDGVDEFLMKNEPDAYPLAFHRFASLFPLALIERHQYLPNLVIYGLSSAAYGAYLYYVGASLFPEHATALVVAGAAVHVFSVSNIAYNGNAILYLSLAERQLARISCGWYFLTLCVALAFHDPLSYALAVLSGALALVTSMFGRQALCFTTVFLCAYLVDAAPLGVAALAFALAFAFDRRYLLRGIAQMVKFWDAYAKYTKRSNWVKPALSRLVDLRKVLLGKASRAERFAELAGHEPTRLVFAFPELFLALALYAGAPAENDWPFLATALATLTVYVLTSVKALNHLGEALRYVEFNLYLLLPLFVAMHFVPDLEAQRQALLIYAAWVGLVVARQFVLWRHIEYPQRDVLAEFLQPLQLGTNDTVFPIPFTLGPGISVRTGCRAITYQGSAVNCALYEKFTEEVPLLKRDWWPLFAEYQVTHVIGLASVVPILKEYLGWEYDLTPLSKLADSKDYVAFRVPPRSAWPSGLAS